MSRISKLRILQILPCLAVSLALQACNPPKEFPVTAADWDARALEYYRQQEYEKACNDWDRAIMIEPNNAVFYWRRARACRQFGRNDQSIDDADKAVSLVIEGHDRRKTMYFIETRAECYAKKGKMDKAIADFDLAIKMSDGGVDSAPLYMERGKAKLQNADPEGAVKDFDKAIELVPTWGRAYHFRAKAYDVLLNFEQGRKDHERALRMGYEEFADRYEPLPITYK